MKKNLELDPKVLKTLTSIVDIAVPRLSEYGVKFKIEDTPILIFKEMLNASVEYVASNIPASGEVSLNLFDILKIGAEATTDEEDENGGNIVPFAEPLKAMKLAFKNDGNYSNEDEFDDAEID